MFTGPIVQKEGDLVALRVSGFTGVIADGTLSSGQRYEIKFSAKSAVVDGLHLLITFPNASALTPEEQVECFTILNAFARELPLAREFGYRYVQNFGGLLTRPEPHAHAIVPGSEAERKKAPRFVDPWGGAA
jgi:hypothetical protein